MCSTSTRPSSAIGFAAVGAADQLEAGADRLCRRRHLPAHPEEARRCAGGDRPSDFERMGDIGRGRTSVHDTAHQARRQRPPDDGDRPSSEQPERRAGARDRSAAGGEVTMEPLSVALIGASVLLAIGLACSRRPQGMAGLARLQTARACQPDRRSRAAARHRPDRAGRPEGTGPQAGSDRRGHRPRKNPGTSLPHPGPGLGGPPTSPAGRPFLYSAGMEPGWRVSAKSSLRPGIGITQRLRRSS